MSAGHVFEGTVTGMTCDHCVASVTEELQEATLLPSMPLDRLSGDETDG